MIYSAVTLPSNGIWARKISSAILLTLCLWPGAVERVAAQQQQAATAAADWPLGVSLERLSATRDRPVFSPSRRPPRVMEAKSAPPPPPPPPPAVPVAPPSLTFFGTFESKDEVGANVQLAPNEKPTIVRFGSYIEGWRVTEISRYRLVLSLDDRTAVFTLFTPKSSANQLTINRRPLTTEPGSRLELAGHNISTGMSNRK